MKALNFKNINRKYLIWVFFALLLMVLLVLSAVLSLTFGQVNISLFDLPKIFAEGGDSMEYSIVSKIRIPRIILGFAVGGSLSLAGVILQGIYRNPLVEPYTLGISGGAALGVALVIVTGLHFIAGRFMMPVFGFVGALVTILLVYRLGLRNGKIRVQNMLLIGVMISFVASSMMMFLMAITTAENLHGIVFWMMGSLDEPYLNLIYVALSASFVGLLVAYLFVKPLNALRLGETKAKHLGFDTEVTIRILFVVASLLTGICVSVAGVIGFVGLVIPHLMRIIIGSDYRILLISSFLGGGIFILLSDLIARTIISPIELPIGVITGIIGGTLFVIVLSRKNFRFS